MKVLLESHKLRNAKNKCIYTIPNKSGNFRLLLRGPTCLKYYMPLYGNCVGVLFAYSFRMDGQVVKGIAQILKGCNGTKSLRTEVNKFIVRGKGNWLTMY